MKPHGCIFQIIKSDCIFYLLQHFPRYVTKKYLWWNQKVIEIIDADTGDRYYGEVHCAKRKKKVEKFIGKGRYEYAKKKRLRRGDIVDFTICNPPDCLFMYILNYQRVVVCYFVKTMEDVLELTLIKKAITLVVIFVGENVINFPHNFVMLLMVNMVQAKYLEYFVMKLQSCLCCF